MIVRWRRSTKAMLAPKVYLGPVMFTTAPVSVAEPVPPPSVINMHPTFPVLPGPITSGVVLASVQVNVGCRVPLKSSDCSTFNYMHGVNSRWIFCYLPNDT